jgi:hypothetical protein
VSEKASSRSLDPTGASELLPEDERDRSAHGQGVNAPRARRKREVQQAVDILRKPVNTLAIVPKTGRITTLARKSYNVLLYEAQDQGLEQDVFRAPLDRVMVGVDFNSNDHALVKKHLRAMVSTTVEWQSPTTGEGTSWNVSGLLAHARLSKERNQVWVEWSYATNLKQELLQPNVFARVRLEVISQLRTYAGVTLYEICTRYKDIGRTSRQQWRWWHPVLTGNPSSERTERIEYRIFKRDTLKPAIAEVNAITEHEIELVEYKLGRYIDEIQFAIRPKRQTALPMAASRGPVDLELIERAGKLGIREEAAEALLDQHGEEALRSGIDAVEKRAASEFPAPLRSAERYLRAIVGGMTVVEGAGMVHPSGSEAPAATPPSAPQFSTSLETAAKRQAAWVAEWRRRRREELTTEIDSLSPQVKAELMQALAEDLRTRSIHPTVLNRLQASGWKHPMVRAEMVGFYARRTHGEAWDHPTPEQLLAVASEVGMQASE